MALATATRQMHGLADVREALPAGRHLDLIVSPQTAETFRPPAKLVSWRFRRWLDEREFSGDRNPRAQCRGRRRPDARPFHHPPQTPSICRCSCRDRHRAPPQATSWLAALERSLRTRRIFRNDGPSSTPPTTRSSPRWRCTSLRDYTDIEAPHRALIARAAQQVLRQPRRSRNQGTPDQRP